MGELRDPAVSRVALSKEEVERGCVPLTIVKATHRRSTPEEPVQAPKERCRHQKNRASTRRSGASGENSTLIIE
jgi:hypothetical protein